MTSIAQFWDSASCHVINFLRHIPNDPQRELTRFVFDVQTHSDGRSQIRWAQGIVDQVVEQAGWANDTIYPSQMWTVGCSACNATYEGDDAQMLTTNCYEDYCDGNIICVVHIYCHLMHLVYSNLVVILQVYGICSSKWECVKWKRAIRKLYFTLGILNMFHILFICNTCCCL